MAKWRWGRRYDLGKRTLAGGTVGGDAPEQQVSGSGNAIAANGGIAVTGIYNDHSSVVLPPEAGPWERDAGPSACTTGPSPRAGERSATTIL
ncbi:MULTISPECIES: hypothetical protein [unclassified Streptomyces]|uniref:hypothetical protein n=1 Tax=unclassified Streptomyces TaxID=2593676 RepID=UPI0033EA4994